MTDARKINTKCDVQVQVAKIMVNYAKRARHRRDGRAPHSTGGTGRTSSSPHPAGTGHAYIGDGKKGHYKI